MKIDDPFTRELFGLFTPDTLLLRHPIPALSAVMPDDRTAVCGEVRVVSDTPIMALCAALRAAGTPDSAMQVRDRRNAAVCLVMSIYDCDAECVP